MRNSSRYMMIGPFSSAIASALQADILDIIYPGDNALQVCIALQQDVLGTFIILSGSSVTAYPRGLDGYEAEEEDLDNILCELENRAGNPVHISGRHDLPGAQTFHYTARMREQMSVTTRSIGADQVKSLLLKASDVAKDPRGHEIIMRENVPLPDIAPFIILPGLLAAGRVQSLGRATRMSGNRDKHVIFGG